MVGRLRHGPRTVPRNVATSSGLLAGARTVTPALWPPNPDPQGSRAQAQSGLHAQAPAHPHRHPEDGHALDPRPGPTGEGLTRQDSCSIHRRNTQPADVVASAKREARWVDHEALARPPLHGRRSLPGVPEDPRGPSMPGIATGLTSHLTRLYLSQRPSEIVAPNEAAR